MNPRFTHRPIEKNDPITVAQRRTEMVMYLLNARKLETLEWCLVRYKGLPKREIEAQWRAAVERRGI